MGLVSLEFASDLGIPEGRLLALANETGPAPRADDGDDDLDVAVGVKKTYFENVFIEFNYQLTLVTK